jgi:flavin reductase (DIM6/NTAB) family NADH-FMN oxidoreductase RutF
MDRKQIALDSFNTDIFKILNKGWMLLTSGDADAGKVNTMTISWGFMGTIWNKPVVIVAVRPQRHTLEFIEKYGNFTICSFPEHKRDMLSLCGSNSGREIDKIKECGLTAVPSVRISSPGFDQAELIVECRVIYKDVLKESNFLIPQIIDQCYPAKDFHHVYFGEVLNISGTEKYVAQA